MDLILTRFGSIRIGSSNCIDMEEDIRRIKGDIRIFSASDFLEYLCLWFLGDPNMRIKEPIRSELIFFNCFLWTKLLGYTIILCLNSIWSRAARGRSAHLSRTNTNYLPLSFSHNIIIFNCVFAVLAAVPIDSVRFLCPNQRACETRSQSATATLYTT